MNPFHANLRRVADAKLEQHSVGVNLKIWLEFRRLERAAFARQFPDGQGVERDGVVAEPELIQHARVLQQSIRAAFVLADKRVGDVEHDAVTEQRQRIDFWHGDGQTVGVVLKTQCVVHAAEREAVKMPACADLILIEQWRDADDFRDFAADDFGHKRFTPDALAFFAEFQIAVNQLADDSHVGIVKIRRVVTGFQCAGDANAELLSQLEKSGGMQIVGVFVPDDDVIRRQTRAEQSANDRFHDRRSRAADFTGGGKNFDANCVIGGNETEPRGGKR